MNDTDPARSAAAAELDRFRGIRQLHNHWARKATKPSYYWYLTFEDRTQLHALAERCRDAIRLAYYDFIPTTGLHMTLDRIAVDGDVTSEVLQAVASAAAHACSDIPAFEINIGGIGGTPGAIGFSTYPSEPLQHLRDTLRGATLSTYPDAPVRAQDFHPHVAIAYCNANVDAAAAVAAVERLSRLSAVTVLISHVALVLLEQQPRAYTWQEIERIQLRYCSGAVGQPLPRLDDAYHIFRAAHTHRYTHRIMHMDME
ncbi:2'-5' RNA ligase family protein [Dactylosporangium salmoneum]